MFPERFVFILMTSQLVKAGEEESTVPPYTYTVNPTAATENTDIHPADLLPNNTVCGISSYLDQFPWMALIVFVRPNGTRFFSCGGALINKRYVLTSTFCIKTFLELTESKCVGVRLGEYNTNTDPDCIRSRRGVRCAPPPIDIDTEEQILHELSVFDMKHNKLAFDVALLRLKKEVEFTETIRPICLFDTPEDQSKTYVGRKLTVAGWSTNLKDIKRQSFIKRKIQIPVTDREACKSKYSNAAPKFVLSDDQFCGGGEQGIAVCGGDYGNPLMVATADEKAQVRWYAVGVVSLEARDCGKKDWPGIFTNISAHIPWILSKLRP